MRETAKAYTEATRNLSDSIANSSVRAFAFSVARLLSARRKTASHDRPRQAIPS